ncbi:Ig-like domain-containing protein [Tenacibaculum sp. 190524A02b]|uniref:Ig-like domain-containing protein n=1 Tax=Tenacibaculum vairaonense TaxID=3137860 RepID=UPI0031FB15E4
MARVKNFKVYPIYPPTKNDFILGTLGTNGKTVNFRISDLCLVCGGDVPNKVPTANDDVYEVNKNTILVGKVAQNDIHGDGDNVYRKTIVTSNGTLDFKSDGTFSYSPNKDFVGTDEFTYEMADQDGDTSLGVVTIKVNDVIVPKVAQYYSFQFDSLVKNINNIEEINAAFLNANATLHEEVKVYDGVKFEFKHIGRYGFVIQNIQKDSISIIDSLNLNVTKTFDSVYNAISETLILVSKEYITPSNLFYKIKKTNNG